MATRKKTRRTKGRRTPRIKRCRCGPISAVLGHDANCPRHIGMPTFAKIGRASKKLVNKTISKVRSLKFV